MTKTTTAQFEAHLKGGFRHNSIKLVKTRFEADRYNARWSGFAGVDLRYFPKQRVFFSAGPGLAGINYRQHQLSLADATYVNEFRLLYLELPVTVGYRVIAGENISLELSGGWFWNVGVSGRNEQHFVALYPSYTEADLLEKVSFGNDQNYNDEFRKVNHGFQVAGAVGLKDRVFVELSYKHGLNNILSGALDNYEVQKLRVVSVGIKYSMMGCRK